MEPLNDSDWDVVIAGTGLSESLLALALSRSGKKILHVDQNDYYGGSSAALSLQDAKKWAERVNNRPGGCLSLYQNVGLDNMAADDVTKSSTRLPPRSYSLPLSSDILYSRSTLLSSIVSSQVHSQMEFLAMGSWWISEQDNFLSLLRVPSGREDLLEGEHVDLKSRRALIKFLKFVSNFEEQANVWEPHGSVPFPAFLEEHFKLALQAQKPIHALAMSFNPCVEVSTAYALPRIARHIRSVGYFGPGFGAVIPKWGGLAEIAQAGCRACAVGGATYMLGTGVTKFSENDSAPVSKADEQHTRPLRITLSNDDQIASDWLIGGSDNLLSPGPKPVSPNETNIAPRLFRSISIISSPLDHLFPQLSESSPTPAGAVVVIPLSILKVDEGLPLSLSAETPIYMIVYSSDTGYCPRGQNIISSSHLSTSSDGFNILHKAVQALLETSSSDNQPEVLWRLQFEQSVPPEQDPASGESTTTLDRPLERVMRFPPQSADPVFDDGVIERVRHAWAEITGEGAEGFMQFAPREGDALDM